LLTLEKFKLVKMAHLYVLLNQSRINNERLTLNKLTDDEIFNITRFPRDSVTELCEILEADLERPTRRSSALSVEVQLLTALQFYGSGSFQWMVGRSEGLSQPTVSRVVDSVTAALCKLARTEITFPMMPRTIVQNKLDFHAIAGFPNVLGAVDGTHIAIKSPSVAEDSYVNRKGIHTINIQGVCDAKLRLLNVVAKWPGSSHDSFMWRSSNLRKLFEDGHAPDGWLLGN
jgi:hypothetical protein